MLLHEEITRSIIGAFYTVYDKLGYGFLEAPYVKAMVLELRKRGHKVDCNVSLPVYYDGVQVGRYIVDLLVDDVVVVEVKASVALSEAHRRQLRNYLKAGGFRVGLLLNFGAVPKFRRLIADDELHPLS